MDSLVLETVEPTLGWRVIPAILLATHGGLHAAGLQLILEGLETVAREAKKGLWADPQSVPLWEWRKQKERHSADIIIAWCCPAWIQPASL